MAAVTTTAYRSMCIVGARQAVSMAVFVDLSLARGEATSAFNLARFWGRGSVALT